MAWRAQHGEVEARIGVEDHEIGWRPFAEPGRVAEPGASPPGTRAQRVLRRAELPKRRNLLTDQAVRKEAARVSAGVDRDARVQCFSNRSRRLAYSARICLA